MQQTTFVHELFCDIRFIFFNRYLPALLYLPSTTHFLRASAWELLVPFYTFGMVRPWDSNTQPPAWKADALLSYEI